MLVIRFRHPNEKNINIFIAYCFHILHSEETELLLRRCLCFRARVYKFIKKSVFYAPIDPFEVIRYDNFLRN
jgi:hypothetical protein